MKLPRVLPVLSIATVLGASSMSFAAPVTIFEDNFDTHADGAEIMNVTPPVGSNYELRAGFSSANVVQGAVNNGGNALSTTRFDGGPPSWYNGYWDAATGLLTGGNTYTITYDVYRSNPESNAGFGIDVGYGPGEFNPTLLHGTGGINNQLLYRDSASGAYLDTGYTAGFGGWETYEIVLTMPANGGDPISGTYDVFLTRDDPANNEGLLPRTQIVDDATAYHNGAPDGVALGRILYYTGPPEPGSGNNSTVYFDNILVQFDAIASGLDGDYNDSGLVEQGDLDQVLANWGAAFDSIPGTWINQRPTEGIVDQAELDVVLTEWGSSAAPSFAGSSVPEPATATLLGLGALALHRRR